MVSQVDAPSEKAGVSIGSVLQNPFVMGGLGVVVSLLIAGFATRYLSNPDAVVVQNPEGIDISAVPLAPSSADSVGPAPKGKANVAGRSSNIALANNQLASTGEFSTDAIPWSFGAIVLGCAGGCLLLARHLNQAVARSRSVPRTLSRFSTTSKRSKTSRQSLQAHDFTIVDRGIKNLPDQSRGSLNSSHTPKSLPHPTTAHLLDAERRTSRPAQPVVTVLPSSAVHPLDWGEEGLANQLDIRKRHSVSQWFNS